MESPSSPPPPLPTETRVQGEATEDRAGTASLPCPAPGGHPAGAVTSDGEEERKGTTEEQPETPGVLCLCYRITSHFGFCQWWISFIIFEQVMNGMF